MRENFAKPSEDYLCFVKQYIFNAYKVYNDIHRTVTIKINKKPQHMKLHNLKDCTAFLIFVLQVLSDNQLGSTGGYYLAKMLENNASLRKLDLAGR